MSSLFKKMARAFVIMDEDKPAVSEKNIQPGATLDEITNDTSSLLAQLEGNKKFETNKENAFSEKINEKKNEPLFSQRQRAKQTDSFSANFSNKFDVLEEIPKLESKSKHTSEIDFSKDRNSNIKPIDINKNIHITSLNAHDVFNLSGLSDSPNSSLRIMKLIAGISMFPLNQQLAMIRAMDAADPSWTEPEIIVDAQKRILVLNEHLSKLELNRNELVSTFDSKIVAAKKDGEEKIKHIDEQIEQLQKQKISTTQEISETVTSLEKQKEELKNSSEITTKGIVKVSNALKQLLKFLSTGEPPPEIDDEVLNIKHTTDANNKK